MANAILDVRIVRETGKGPFRYREYEGRTEGEGWTRFWTIDRERPDGTRERLSAGRMGERAEKLAAVVARLREVAREEGRERPNDGRRAPARDGRGHERARGFRPVEVEKPKPPTLPNREYAVVGVVEPLRGGAVLEVRKVFRHRGLAELYALFRRDAAVFPRSFEPGRVRGGMWLRVESTGGFDRDPNARKLNRLIEGERARAVRPPGGSGLEAKAAAAVRSWEHYATARDHGDLGPRARPEPVGPERPKGRGRPPANPRPTPPPPRPQPHPRPGHEQGPPLSP